MYLNLTQRAKMKNHQSFISFFVNKNTYCTFEKNSTYEFLKKYNFKKNF